MTPLETDRPDVGFVCRTWDDYLNAVERLDEISPAACRAKATRDFHYSRMAAEYVTEYRAELANGLRTEGAGLI